MISATLSTCWPYLRVQPQTAFWRIAFVRLALQGVRFRIRRLENETREVSGKMNDVLARAACNFEDDARQRQDIAKDIENEVAIT